jgi:ubiquinone/menaquinone biosynthesis C-methylase UbiE
MRDIFYYNVIYDTILDKNSSILVCGGEQVDRDTFKKAGFLNVTISGLDTRMKSDDFAPFKWKYENAESLSFNNGSFDYVVIHDAIHHSSSPHKVLTEMYRVAKKGILAFESRDSVIMRFLEKFGFTQIYENSSVYFNNCKYGGVNNTDIPNFIYRWTEREIEKTIQSYAPYCQHKFAYKYGNSFPSTPELKDKGQLKKYFLNFMRPFYYVLVKLFPKQQNLFSFYIEKPLILNSLFPWLVFDNKENKIIFNKKWGEQQYKNTPPNLIS